MSYNNYSLEKNKCKWCWMKRERPELKIKLEAIKTSDYNRRTDLLEALNEE